MLKVAWRNVCSKKLQGLHSTSNVRSCRPDRMKWTGHTEKNCEDEKWN